MIKVKQETGNEIFIDSSLEKSCHSIYVYTMEKTVSCFKKSAPIYIDSCGIRYFLSSVEKDPMGTYIGIYKPTK